MGATAENMGLSVPEFDLLPLKKAQNLPKNPHKSRIFFISCRKIAGKIAKIQVNEDNDLQDVHRQKCPKSTDDHQNKQYGKEEKV